MWRNYIIWWVITICENVWQTSAHSYTNLDHIACRSIGCFLISCYTQADLSQSDSTPRCILGYLMIAEGYEGSLMSFSSPWISRLVPKNSTPIYVSVGSFYFKLAQINRAELNCRGGCVVNRPTPLVPAVDLFLFRASYILNFLLCGSLGVGFKGSSVGL